MKKTFFIFIILTFFLTSCATRTVQLEVHGSSVLNPNKNYRSLPVKINIYQLKQADSFNQADFYSLWNSPQRWLKRDLVTQQSSLITPGEKKTIKIQLHKKTQYIGIIAIFRKPGSEGWRVIKSIKNNLPIINNRITISLVSNRIYLRQ